MVMSTEEARKGICKIATSQIIRQVPKHIEALCVADKCVTYWRWADEAHTKGYCAAAGKPEF